MRWVEEASHNHTYIHTYIHSFFKHKNGFTDFNETHLKMQRYGRGELHHYVCLYVMVMVMVTVSVSSTCRSALSLSAFLHLARSSS